MVRQSLKNRCAAAFLGLLALAVPMGCVGHAPPSAEPPAASEPPPAPREFRAAWVATVANIDWPSARGLPVDAQQAEAKEIIALARTLGLNALILQVRPAADALYASTLEPWSEYLTGTQGKPPEPYYDPLAFWVEEAHRAGLELHAWFNPYRFRHPTATSAPAANHLGSTRPDLVRSYGDQLWLDPGEPGSAEHVMAVVLDVVRRYDVDGVHYDDYFYPYPIQDATGQKVEFPDSRAWLAYLDQGGPMYHADWRRRNVDGLVERIYREVHRVKPHVRVGVSPFGLGRPDRRPPGVTGFSQYDELYADVELWLEKGWMDYLAPQLYWRTQSAGQPFVPLLDYWRAQNTQARHIWPGLFTSRAGSPDPWPAEEISNQIQLTRSPGFGHGHVHFSMVALKKNYGGINGLLAGAYASPALAPATGWLGGEAPPAPTARVLRHGTDPAILRVEVGVGDQPWRLAVWGRYGGAWRFFALPPGGGSIPAQSGSQPLGLALVSAIGRTGLESPRLAAKDERY